MKFQEWLLLRESPLDIQLAIEDAVEEAPAKQKQQVAFNVYKQMMRAAGYPSDWERRLAHFMSTVAPDFMDQITPRPNNPVFLKKNNDDY